jgi:hypothetical protein
VLLPSVSWATLFAYAGDALWVIALTIMFAASRQASARTLDRPRLRYLGGQGPRLIVLWGLPVASFAVSLWPALQARMVGEESSFVLFGVRAITASLLALLHLRGLRDTLKP